MPLIKQQKRLFVLREIMIFIKKPLIYSNNQIFTPFWTLLTTFLYTSNLKEQANKNKLA